MKKNHQFILYAACAIVLITYCIAVFFAHPAADDFTYAVLGQSDDFVQTVLNER